MEKAHLETYKSNADEIEELKGKLKKMGTEEGKEKLVESDTILDYQKGYPRPQTVTGYNYKKEWHLRQRYSDRIEKLEKEQKEIEQWVFDIRDNQLQRIFRLRYLERRTLEEVASKVHMDKSTVSRKIENYLNLQQMQQKI